MERARARGRPRGFDRDEALGRAVQVFWRRGYQDASVSALAEAMGIGSASLYAAFSSKAALFREAADRYQSLDAARPDRELEEGATARASVEGWLRANVDLFTRRGGPRGCLLTRAASSCPHDEPDVRRYLDASCRDRVTAVERRLRRAADAGESLPASPPELARLLDTVLQGLAVRAIEGASRPSLQATIDLALATWLPP